MTSPTDTIPCIGRGGGWVSNDVSWVRAADRNWIAPSYCCSSVGFRCALNLRRPL